VTGASTLTNPRISSSRTIWSISTSRCSWLGHGVENPADGIHGDEEYLYVVELPTRNPFDEPAKWTVKVSGHSAFPRWDGATDEAFERASWQFNGPLEHALEEMVAEPA
jgi:hypothetical protein